MPLPATLPPALFVTGTDTEIGKTAASTALLHALRRRGLRAVGMKPVASGSEDLAVACATKTHWRCRRPAGRYRTMPI